MPTASRRAEIDAVSPIPTCSVSASIPSPFPASPAPTSRRDRRPDTETLRHAADGDHDRATIEPEDLDGFAAEIRREMEPSTLLEQVLVERVVLASWRLRCISRRETARILASPTGGEVLPVSREVLRAESSLETALVLLEAARSARRSRWGHAAQVSTRLNPADLGDGPEFEPDDAPADDLPDLSNEWASVPEPDEPDDAAPSPCWHGRLVFDRNISETSPVVRGTWVTVSQVVSLVVDDWTWSDILRAHPELSEDDIRACLSYSVEHDREGL